MASQSLFVLTPPGRLGHPQFLTPNPTSAKYNAGKYTTILYVSNTNFQDYGEKFVNSILEVGRSYFGNPDLGIMDFKNPLNKEVNGKYILNSTGEMTDEKRAKLPDAVMKDHIVLNFKGINKPKLYGCEAPITELSEEVANNMGAGDWARLSVSIFPYAQSGGGVSAGLNAVQFIRTAERFSQSGNKTVEMFESMEVPADALPELAEVPTPATEQSKKEDSVKSLFG